LSSIADKYGDDAENVETTSRGSLYSLNKSITALELFDQVSLGRIKAVVERILRLRSKIRTGIVVIRIIFYFGQIL